jgi:hypothetical protein
VTSFLTLTEEHRIRVYKNRALRRIFRLKRDEIIGGSNKLLNEKLHDVCFVSSVITMTIQ